MSIEERERERENAPRDGKAKREKRFIHAVLMKISKYGKVVCTETCRLMYEGKKFYIFVGLIVEQYVFYILSNTYIHLIINMQKDGAEKRAYFILT